MTAPVADARHRLATAKAIAAALLDEGRAPGSHLAEFISLDLHARALVFEKVLAAGRRDLGEELNEASALRLDDEQAAQWAELVGTEDPATTLALDGWRAAPTPLTSAVNVPAFPIEALPPWLAQHVSAVADATQTPIDLAGTYALVVISAVAARKVTVRVQDNWTEPVALWSIVVQRPGAGKSPMWRAMTEPLEQWEQDQVTEARAGVAQYDALARAAKKRVDRAEADLAKAGGADRAEAENGVRVAVQERDELEADPERLPRLLAEDCTPEKLVGLLEAHGGRMAVLSDESGPIGILAGRYSEGRVNLDSWLKAWSGSQLRVDRAGRPSEFVADPQLVLGLTIQPAVLRQLTEHPEFRGRGFLGRILWSMPTDQIGYRNVRAPALSSSQSASYSHRLRQLADALNPLDREPIPSPPTPTTRGWPTGSASSRS